MYSAYIFLALLFGQEILFGSATTVTITQDNAKTTDKVLAFTTSKAMDADTKMVKVVPADGTLPDDLIEDVKGSTGKSIADIFLTTIELDPGTLYDLYYSDGDGTQAVQKEFATKPSKPVVTFKSGDATSAKLEWTNFDTYDSTSVKRDSEAFDGVTSKDIDMDDGKPSTLYEFVFTGTKHSQTSAEETLKICTAPTKPTVTHESKSDGAATPVYTLNLKMAFAAEDFVSEIVIDFGVDVTDPTKCDQSDCKDCEACTTQAGSSTKQLILTTTDTNKGATYAVIISNYPDANLHSDFKIAAKYDQNNACVAPNIGEVVYDLKSVASLAKQEALLVYLAIGTMIAVLRMFGLDVWSPLGSH